MTSADDEKHMERAIAEAEQCKNQYTDREDPKVGAVALLKDGTWVSAHRGEPVGAEDPLEVAGDHGEFTLMKKCKAMDLRGATVYTTLEPCTTRKHPKIPCAEHLIRAGVARVVIGMVDPNPLISGRGIGRLRQRGIKVDLFPDPFAARVETQNKPFAEYQSGPSAKIIAPASGPALVTGEASTVAGELSRAPAKNESIRCFVRKDVTYWPQREFGLKPPDQTMWECDVLLHELIEYEFLITKVSPELAVACTYYFLYGEASNEWKGFVFPELPTGMQVLARIGLRRTS